jgi:tetratricopeptide (TPR) repeat protein
MATKIFVSVLRCPSITSRCNILTSVHSALSTRDRYFTMRLILGLLTLLPFWMAVAAPAHDFIREEVEFRESPQTLFDRLEPQLPLPLSFDTAADFSQLAEESGYEADFLLHRLQLLAKLYLEPAVQHAQQEHKAEDLIVRLEQIASHPYDQAMVALLRGRFIGRYKLDYPRAIERYQQALRLVDEADNVNARLLKLLIHDHLGTLNLLIRQNDAALTHVTQFHAQAKLLDDHYLLAAAETALGFYHNRAAQSGAALTHYVEAFRLINLTDYPLAKTKLQLQLAQAYRDLGQWDEALRYAKGAAEGFQKLQQDPYLSKSMTVIAMVHAKKNEWNQAIDFYLNAQQIDERRGSIISQALNFHNLGEAYFKLGDHANALSYLQRANRIFRDKNSKHYLVYNELLLADVLLSTQDWQSLTDHASAALAWASELELTDEQIQALTLQATAYKHLGKLVQALDVQDRIIELTAQKSPTPPQDEEPAVLERKKLALELSELKNRFDSLQQTLQTWQLSTVLGGLLLLALVIIVVHQWRARWRLTDKLKRLAKRTRRDPLTGHQGFPALLDALDKEIQAQETAPRTLALLSLCGQENADLQLGLRDHKDHARLQIEAIERTLDTQVYAIRPGVLALLLTPSKSAQDLFDAIQAILERMGEQSSLRMGLTALPLLPQPEIRLAREIYFEVLQLALAAAQSLPGDGGYYVSLKALDFTPVTVFNAPVFDNLTRNIARGMIRVETNGDKNDLLWPGTASVTDTVSNSAKQSKI